jgi:hypothetical protein
MFNWSIRLTRGTCVRWPNGAIDLVSRKSCGRAYEWCCLARGTYLSDSMTPKASPHSHPGKEQLNVPVRDAGIEPRPHIFTPHAEHGSEKRS